MKVDIDREGFGPLPWWLWGLYLGYVCLLAVPLFGVLGLGLFAPLFFLGFGLIIGSFVLAFIQA